MDEDLYQMNKRATKEDELVICRDADNSFWILVESEVLPHMKFDPMCHDLYFEFMDRIGAESKYPPPFGSHATTRANNLDPKIFKEYWHTSRRA